MLVGKEKDFFSQGGQYIKTGLLLILTLLRVASHTYTQSVELMPGTERIFADVQWLKPLGVEYQWTIFSRTRTTVDYEDENRDFFSGLYLNYTSKSGFGGSVVGRLSTTDAGVDTGPHFFKQTKDITLFALASISLQSELSYSWFSILRYTPELSEKWKVYSSLELFSAFRKVGHAVSVQRIRLGLDRSGYQFGMAVNFRATGRPYSLRDTNPGLFIRKQL